MRILSGDEHRIIIYPCRDNSKWNFVAIHPDDKSKTEGEGWTQSSSEDTLLKSFDGFADDVKTLLAKANPDGA